MKIKSFKKWQCTLFVKIIPVTGFPLASVTPTTDWVTGLPLASIYDYFLPFWSERFFDNLL